MFRLALALGRADVDGLNAELSESQLREWTAFFGLEPWGAESAFWRAGIVAATVANAAPGRKPGSRPFVPQDFMPEFSPPTNASERAETSSEPANVGGGAKALRAALVAAFAGRVQGDPKL